MSRVLRYRVYGILFQVLCLTANIIALMFLFVLLGDVILRGAGSLSLDFLTGSISHFPEKTGMFTAIGGTAYMMVLTALIAVPMGIGAAIYLEEYSRNTPLVQFIKLNIQNLASVPSIIYGILGLTLFVRFMGLGKSVLAGSLTMAILILPIITISAQEALRAVPDSFRQAGFGIGMTRWQVVRYMVMPIGLPGMLTGVILALSRAIGETAPLIMIGALTFIDFLPCDPLEPFTSMPIQIYNWTREVKAEFQNLAAAGIIVLMVILLMMNGIAIWMRSYYRKRLRNIQS